MAGRLVDAGFALDVPQLRKVHDGIARHVLGAGTGAIKAATRGLEQNLEEQTRAAVAGGAWRAWASDAYPKMGIARDPVGVIYLKGRSRTVGMMQFFTESGRIKGKRDQWLAFPTAAAGSRGRSRNLTPGEWERQTGQRLRFIYRKGKPGLLVADGTTNQRSGSFRRITRERTAADLRRGFMRGQQSVIIFILVPHVDFANRFAIDPTIAGAEGELMKEFVARMRG